MSIKAQLAYIFAKKVVRQTQKWAHNPVATQQKVFLKLIRQAQHTQFGKDHCFEKIKTFRDFADLVPIKDYEALKPYFDRVVAGEQDVLWKGKPLYFAKTSGTTSGSKYIPLTKASLPEHIKAAQNAILHYINETKNASIVDRKMIFLQGNPTLESKNGIKHGRLSGIVAHFVPKYLQKNRLPSWKTNCIDDWEHKVDAIVSETFSQDMGVISGIPSWVLMYFEKLHQKSKMPITDLFPNFQLFIYGGVNYEPYRAKFEYLMGKKVDSIELFPASEGFFAYQDRQDIPGMLLLLNSGIFYEFVKASDFFDQNPKRYTIGEVLLDENYVLIISSNAGLWGYNIGDTVQFVSLNPHRIVVSGRVKHFISAFGEHVIGKEVETAMAFALEGTTASINEFTVAPQITPQQGLPFHEWCIEFENEPQNIIAFAAKIDAKMREQNAYYDDLIVGKVLKSLEIRLIRKNGFQDYMKSIGKLGGQNKLPRLSNDRKIVDQLI